MMKYDNININIITHVDNMLDDEICQNRFISIFT